MTGTTTYSAALNGAIAPQPGAVEILLVEDNPRDAELTLRALRKHHLANQVVWVQDGVAALELIFGPSGEPGTLLNHTPKMVLLDLKLPKVDGHELLRRLKADARTRTIPVVVLTSSREEMDIERSYELGVNSYIVKPVEFDNFSEAVQQLGLYWLLLNQPPENRPPAGGQS
jgi:two-component system response regulator